MEPNFGFAIQCAGQPGHSYVSTFVPETCRVCGGKVEATPVSGPNITLVAFCEEWSEGPQDDRTEHAADFRILHPSTKDEAAEKWADLMVQGDEDDHGEWEVTVLLNGRECDAQEEVDFAEAIKGAAQQGWRAAQLRRRKAKEEAARKRRERRAVEEAAERERAEIAKEKREREEYERLRQKFGRLAE